MSAAVTVEGPAWDLSTEYPGVDSAELAADLATVEGLFAEIEEANPAIEAVLAHAAGLTVDTATDAIAAAQRVHALVERAGEVLGDIATFVNCLLSVDATDTAALEMQGRLQGVQKRAGDVRRPWSHFVDLVPDDVIDAYLDHPDVAPSAFVVRHGRERRHELLGLSQESLVNGLAQDGIHAWGRLYTQLSGTIECRVELPDGAVETMGLAQAAGLMQRPDPAVREAAWRAVNVGWSAHDETCAAALNAIAGWRREMAAQRSGRQDVHYLDASIHASRFGPATLDALLDAAADARPLARRAARAMARAMGRDALGPWDVRAPAPVGGAVSATTFEEAVDLIAAAYGGVHPDMGDFVRMMVANRWVEGTVAPTKRPGAYCTRFMQSRTPRVYTTFSGSTDNVITLAHELGHAFHGWVMRDLPASQQSYGMSLAETASTFGEAAVRDVLLARAESPADQLAIVWEEMQALTAFLLNIPVRYHFERGFYDRRAERPLRPDEFRMLMTDTWTEWYGGTCEPDPMFWANKLHFFISGLAFYNFPYLFGYLFSNGVYQRRGEGDDFYPRYTALLADTGRSTAEALADIHLGLDLTDAATWRGIVDGLAPRVDAFERLVDTVS